ncbi:MAG TPA: hypothetical protein VF914_05725 [Chloroflexia bacterium]|jgi:hypothetical protein
MVAHANYGPELSLVAPIIPNEGLGGLRLRTEIRQIQDLILKQSLTRRDMYRLAGPFVAEYKLGEGEIQVSVDVRDGRIYQLTAGEGYKGGLFSNIFVGMAVTEAMRIQPGLFYDEAESLIRYKGVGGLAIDLPEDDLPPALVPQMHIHSISVYAVEIETFAGQDGDW